jgi:alkylation response protein AidB-like acyl-CoA dehydrogenase
VAPAQEGSGTDPAGTFETARQEAADWLAASWDPQLTVRDWWARLAESGWGFPQWPREWFGRGLRADAVAGARAAFTAAGALGPPASLGQLLGAPTLLVHGSQEQKERFLPLLARGEEAWCQFFSEPGSGSDLASAQTRAVRDGDVWTVDGQKVWTSGAQSADRGMLLARTNRDLPKHQGLSYFIIDVGQPGIEVRPLHQMNGAHGFNEVFFTGATADADRLVGEEGGGWSVAVTTLMYERFMSSLPSVAPGRRAGQLDRPAGEAASGAARIRARGRTGVSRLVIEVARQLGLEDDPVTRQRLAALSGQEMLLGYLARAGQEAGRTGRRPGAQGSLSKLGRSALARAGREAGMSVLGAQGMLNSPDTPGRGEIQIRALSSPGASIAGGTDEIQRGIVSERVLGLPKEPRTDRDVPFRDLTIGTQRTPG